MVWLNRLHSPPDPQSSGVDAVVVSIGVRGGEKEREVVDVALSRGIFEGAAGGRLVLTRWMGAPSGGVRGLSLSLSLLRALLESLEWLATCEEALGAMFSVDVDDGKSAVSGRRERESRFDEVVGFVRIAKAKVDGGC